MFFFALNPEICLDALNLLLTLTDAALTLAVTPPTYFVMLSVNLLDGLTALAPHTAVLTK